MSQITLRARIDREATATTPIYSPIVGLYMCIKILEELLSLIDEADGINISVNDLICMMLQIGLSD